MSDERPAPIPESAAQSAGQGPTEEEIRVRAHEISLGPDAGTPEENWLRAELELVDAMRATREHAGDARQADVDQAREEEAAALGHAHWFSQGHP